MTILLYISLIALGGAMFYPLGYGMGMKRKEEQFNKSINELEDK